MIRVFINIFICVFINITLIHGQDVDTTNVDNSSPNLYEKTTTVQSVIEKVSSNKLTDLGNELVKIQLYYECLCPDCRNFDAKEFKQTVLELGSHLDIHLYPYGNAKTIDKGGGNYEFTCQHGPAECYGNKLHACAIDVLQNITMAVLYNSCLMDYSQAENGSDDAAADVCGNSMSIDSRPIKQCAKGFKGTELLKLIGDESKEAAFTSVPHVLINCAPGRDHHFKEDVCKAFKIPPSECNTY